MTTTTTAYKFLTRGATGPLSGADWPLPLDGIPGAWVDAGAGPLELCARGAHVCRPADLAYWLHDDLWQVEVAGDQIVGIDCLVVRRARLVRRFDNWRDGGVTVRFGEACVAHAAGLVSAKDRNRAYFDDAAEAVRYGYPAVAAFAAALAVARAAEGAEESAYRTERAWQSAWIARELAL